MRDRSARSFVFEIHRPWPQRAPGLTRTRALRGVRWDITASVWTLAGRAFYWPVIVTVWHLDPHRDGTSCRLRGRAWKWHVHHWRLEVPVLPKLRRLLLTRCSWCGGRNRRTDRVNTALHAEREPAPWWRGETGRSHRDCAEIKGAHSTCVCTKPVLEHGDYGFCARCCLYRPDDITAEALARCRELAEIPSGNRQPTAPVLLETT